MNRFNKTAFTLAELLIATFIFMVGIGSTLMLFANSMVSSDYAWQMTTATTHAETILEEMELKKSLADITVTDWQQWAADAKLLTLPGETVKVDFFDTGADPLDIDVIVAWKGKIRQSKVEIKTKMTK